jgi:hypothetical protein
LIIARKLTVAREQLKYLGFDRETARHWIAYLPKWFLDTTRVIRRCVRR